MTKWYCLNPQGDMQYVGEFETFDEADESLEHDYAWLVDEEVAREWLAQLKELLEA